MHLCIPPVFIYPLHNLTAPANSFHTQNSHIKVNDLVTVRIPRDTRDTIITKSKMLGFTKKGPYLCIGLAGKGALLLRDVLWGTDLSKAITRSQCHNSSSGTLHPTLPSCIPSPDIPAPYNRHYSQHS
ncbi:hypothetical protein CYMTET_7874 [Cymbomonas tetramitiformis]|uniref:Uncharacterized protein n=1 Tax=Cymbomonas tetramitiformis TaxID=36881 RepID=A0AAE0LGJ7_9CHLO|nr:hypothetical protein CYMTET_7874 [Cymbomonas tetramitiformis]